MPKKSQKRMTIEQALAHLTDVSGRVHREVVSLHVQMEDARKTGEPDLISALTKMIAYECKTLQSLYAVGQWFRTMTSVNRTAASIVGMIPDLGKKEKK